MKKFKDLAASDFPGIDVQKFEVWKNAVLDANRNTGIMLLRLLLLNIILFLTTGSVILWAYRFSWHSSSFGGSPTG